MRLEIDSLSCIRKASVHKKGDAHEMMLCWHFYSFIFLRSCHVVIHTRASKTRLCLRFSQDALTLHAHTATLTPLARAFSVARRGEKKAQITPVPSLTQKPPPPTPPTEQRLRLFSSLHQSQEASWFHIIIFNVHALLYSRQIVYFLCCKIEIKNSNFFIFVLK